MSTAQEVVNKMFIDYIPNFGKPNQFITDHGTRVKSKIWTDKLEEN